VNQRKNARIFALVLAGGLVALAIACSVGSVDFADKACPCGGDYVCDSARNVCVLPGMLGQPSDDGGVDAPVADSGPNACIGDSCPCTGDPDCKDPARHKCSPEKVCVECVATSDTCPAGSYCNASNQCVLGCKEESDCQISPAAPHCETTRHQCVACRTLGDCTGADRCSPSGECVAGCDLDAGKLCALGKECCDGLCIDTKRDPFNCGACGVACSTQNGTPACTPAGCSWTCANGYGHCATGNTGCETNQRSDALHCGACTTDCNALVVNANNVSCTAASCGYATCKANFYDCDGKADSGCECPCGGDGEICCPGKVCSVGTCRGNNRCM
jgi:hypothetical protein